MRRYARRGRILIQHAAKLFKPWRSSQSAEALMLISSAVLIGVLVGFAAVGFDLMIHSTQAALAAMRGQLSTIWASFWTVLIPIIGGLLITPIILWASPDVRGSGIPAVMLAVSNLEGYVAKRIVLWRPLASTISIGTGASLGTEGPVVQLGGAIASLVSRLFQFNNQTRRNLVAVAAASGISATFNAPIAGVLFALEVILGQFGNKNFAIVVIGSVSASIVSRQFLGADPAFPIPEYQFSDLIHLPLYLLLGLVAAVASVIFIRLVVLGDDMFNHIPLPKWTRPMLGGLLIGLLALALPDVLGGGYNVTGELISGEVKGFGFLVIITLAKMVATSISLGSWGSGGIFAPLLMIGSSLGAALAYVAGLLGPLESSGEFALVGMAAMFSGTARAPMSTIMMIFEMSGSYGMILPLLLSTVVATLVADLIHPESIYQVILSRKGLSLMRLREHDLLQSVTVREVMESDIPLLSVDATLKEFKDALVASEHQSFILTTPGHDAQIWGIVTLSDLEKARQEGVALTSKLREIGNRTVQCALPNEPISDVLERMVSLGIRRMPVIDAKGKRYPIGFVEQSHLAKAYYQALNRQRQASYNREHTLLRDLTGQKIIEVRVRPESPLAGKTLREAGLPRESIVVSVRKGSQTVFPHGDTRMEVGDIVVANVAPGFSTQFKALFVAS